MSQKLRVERRQRVQDLVILSCVLRAIGRWKRSPGRPPLAVDIGAGLQGEVWVSWRRS